MREPGLGPCRRAVRGLLRPPPWLGTGGRVPASARTSAPGRTLSTAAAGAAASQAASGAVWQLGALGEPYASGEKMYVRARAATELASSLAMSGKPRRLMSEGVLVPEERQPVRACVLVGNLPRLILPEEVQRIAGPELGAQVDAVELLYDRTATFRGEAVVTLTSPEAAASYASWAARSLVSGRAVKTKILTLGEGKDLVFPFDAYEPRVRKHNGLSGRSLFASYLISRFGGRVVAFGGVPRHLKPKSVAQMLWHGDWALEPTARSTEWNLLLTRLYYRMCAVQAQPDRFPPDTLDLIVRSSRDSGARARGLTLSEYPTEEGLIDAGNLDPIFAFNPVMDLYAANHLIVMATEAEAHRFCVRFHKQPFHPEKRGWSFIAYARILR